jgi:hypothetical protein
VFQNTVLRRIFGPNTEEATGGWRKIHDAHMNNLYSLPDSAIIRIFTSEGDPEAGHVAIIEKRGTMKILYLLRGLSPQANYTERPPHVGEVSANFCG